MNLLSRDNDTICALSTPPGRGGIAVVRVSGSAALANTRKIARFLPVSCESHRCYFGRLYPVDDEKTQLIDEAVVTFFAKGKSYTGEETLEISTHGSPYIVNFLLDELVKTGCRPAEKGEFTYRAFMNNNLDLVQAESVLALIESQSRQAAKNASRQLTGELSTEFSSIENQLINAMANLEASIDFSTEDIEPFQKEELVSAVLKLDDQVERLISSYQMGRVLQEGFRVAIVGSPNSGKSSLLNAIVQFDCAIVTDIPGTTRDVVAAEASLGGITVKFLDTAGIRETSDQVESIGIQKSFSEIEKADLALVLLDLSREDLSDDIQLIRRISKDQLVWVVGNKTDISKFGIDQSFEEYLFSHDLKVKRVFEVSARQRSGVDVLLKAVEEQAGQGLVDDNPMVTSARQVKDLKHIKLSIKKALSSLVNNESPEFTAFEMQEAVLAIHRLLGKEYDDQVMDRVFSEFCIGK